MGSEILPSLLCKLLDKIIIPCKGKLDSRPPATCSTTNDALTLHSTGSTKIKRQIKEFQPDLLPSNESSILMVEKGDRDRKDRQEKQLKDNPRSKYNSNVQKYLKEKYGSTRLTAGSKMSKDSMQETQLSSTAN